MNRSTDKNHAPSTKPCYALACAMDIELQPFLDYYGAYCLSRSTIFETQIQSAELLELPSAYLLLIKSGIGMGNAGYAATRAISWLKAQGYALQAYLCAGTCGGFEKCCMVGDTLIATRYYNWKADATACDYAPGQLPGLPPYFESDAKLLTAAQGCIEDYLHELKAQATKAECLAPRVHCAPLVSSDSFVTAEGVEEIETHFTKAAAADMESAAAALVCWHEDLPFITIRTVSDLCAPKEVANQAFNLGAEQASQLSARFYQHFFKRLLEL